MAHYVYIIYSPSFDIYYKGESSDPFHRLIDHNDDKSVYTSGKGPWELVYITKLEDRTAAIKREKEIKRLNRRSIEKLIRDASNLLLKEECRPVTSRHVKET
jgi:putative endonuclease